MQGKLFTIVISQCLQQQLRRCVLWVWFSLPSQRPYSRLEPSPHHRTEILSFNFRHEYRTICKTNSEIHFSNRRYNYVIPQWWAIHLYSCTFYVSSSCIANEYVSQHRFFCLSEYSDISILGLNHHAIVFQYPARDYPLSVYMCDSIYIAVLHDELDQAYTLEGNCFSRALN